MSSHNVETVNKFIKTYNTHAELLFCLLNDLYQENMRMGPVYIEKNFPGVTFPARVNLSKCLCEKWLTPFARAENSRLAHALILSPNRVDPGWASHVFTWRKVGLARKVTLPPKKGSSRTHYLFFRVIKRQVSVRKCSKCWLAQGSSGRRVTLLLGATFLHIRGRPCSSWKTSRYWLGKQYELTKFRT